jgi:guanosine-3',5'-bis(diphosphate) 3'-pyrophosphohydrolase
MLLPTEALNFALRAHAGQLRKYTGEPYIIHPIAVACILQQHYPETREWMIEAALLHDVIEDTSYTARDLLGKFSQVTVNMVQGLTDVSKPEDGNRAVRKTKDCAHIANQHPHVQIIKCADIIHNTQDIAVNSPTFAKIYLPEVKCMLGVMHPDTKETAIWKFAWGTVITAEESL